MALSKKKVGLDTRVVEIIRVLRKAYPDARLALTFSNPLELLIALILAAQCTDQRVNEVTRSLFKKYRTARDYAETRQETLEEEIRSTGFYRNKAKAIRGCCQEILVRFQGKVPDRTEDLVGLPGVGRKTANIIIGNAFGRPAIGVDTHVMRLSQRMGLTQRGDPDHIEEDLCQIIPEKDWVSFCHLIQVHGRRVCTARAPQCSQCPVEPICPKVHVQK